MNKLALIVALTLALSAAATAQTTDKSGKAATTILSGPTTLGGGVPAGPSSGPSSGTSSSPPTGTAVR